MAYKTEQAPQVQEDACRRYIDTLVNDARAGAKACEDSLHLQALSSNLTARDLKALQRARRRKMATAGKAVGAGEEPPPRNLKEAFGNPQRGELWRKAALEEFEGLTDMGVYDHDYSWDELAQVGIDTALKPRQQVTSSKVS